MPFVEGWDPEAAVLKWADLQVREELKRPVVGFGRSAGKEDLLRLHAERGGDAGARLLDVFSRRGAPSMKRMGVSEIFDRNAKERLQHFAAHRAGRGVVEVLRDVHQSEVTRPRLAECFPARFAQYFPHSALNGLISMVLKGADCPFIEFIDLKLKVIDPL